MAWEDLTSISKLSVQLETGSYETTIYGNGHNQIGVVVYVKGLNSNGDYVSITADEIIQNTRLIDYVTGEELKREENTGWNYTNAENDYHTIPGAGRSKRDAQRTTATYYVQCPPHERLRTKSIAVKANLSNGTTYSTAKNSSSGFDSKVHLTALEAISYNNGQNIIKTEDTLRDIRNDIHWSSKLDVVDFLKHHYDGKVRKKIVRLAPKNGTKFIDINISHNPVVGRDDVGKERFNYLTNVDDSTVDSFRQSYIGASSHLIGQPAAIIGQGGGTYDVNIWVPMQPGFGDSVFNVDYSMYFADNSYIYSFYPRILDTIAPNSDWSDLIFVLYNFNLPENNLRQYKWHDAKNPVTVDVKDIYGNAGTFTVEWNDSNGFWSPMIH